MTGRLRALFVFLAVAVALCGDPAVPAAAACDAGTTCANLWNGSSFTSTDYLNNISGGANTERGVRFTVDVAMTVHEIGWYRCSTGAQRPPAFRIWVNGVIGNGFAGSSTYTDITDNGGVGWQTTNLAGSNRLALSPGVTYELSYSVNGTSLHACTANGFTPVPNDANLNFVGNYIRTFSNGYPMSADGGWNGLTIGTQYALAATATPGPTDTPAPSPTGTMTPTVAPTATATPIPPPVYVVDDRPQLEAIATAITQEGNDQAAAIAAAGAAQGTAIAQAGAAQATAIAQAAGSATSDSWGIQAALDAIGSTLGAWLENIGGQIAGVPAAITDSSAALGAAVGGAIDAASTAAASASAAATQAIADASAAATVAAAAAATSAATALGALGTAISAAVSLAGTGIETAIDGVSSGVTSLVTATNGVKDAIADGLFDLGDGIGDATREAGGWIRDSVDGIGPLLTGIGTAISGIGGGIAGIPGAIGDATAALGATISGLPAAVGTALTGALVPADGYLEGKGEALMGQLMSQVPAPLQVRDLAGDILDGMAATSCEGQSGVPLLLFGTTLYFPGNQFYLLWCPFWRPFSGAVFGVFMLIIAGKQLFSMLSPPGSDN